MTWKRSAAQKHFSNNRFIIVDSRDLNFQPQALRLRDLVSHQAYQSISPFDVLCETNEVARDSGQVSASPGTSPASMAHLQWLSCSRLCHHHPGSLGRQQLLLRYSYSSLIPSREL